MLKLDEKDYDVNNLLGINFDILKEVLLKLSQNQSNIQIEIREVKDSNKERDNKISELENKLNELNNLINSKEKLFPYEINEKPIEKREEKNIIEDISYKEKYTENKKDNIFPGINIHINNEKIDENKNIKNEIESNNKHKDEFLKDESLNIETKINIVENRIKDEDIITPKEEYNKIKYGTPKTERIKIDNNQINENEKDINEKNLTFHKEKEINKEIGKDQEEEKNKNKKDIFKKRDREKKPIYKTSKEIIDLNSAVLQKSKSSYEVIRNILHKITDINDKVNFIEINFSKKFDALKEYSDEILSDHNMQSMTKFNSMKKKIDDLQEKYDEIFEKLEKLAKIEEFEQKLEEISKKNHKPEIFHIFNDDDDQKKIMSSTFKDSLNKKFELNDNRYMKAAGDNINLKNQYLTVKGITDKLSHQITLLRKDFDDMKDSIEGLKKENNELIENKNNELKNDIKEQMDKNIEYINDNIDKKTRELLNLLMDENNSNTNNKDTNKDNSIDISMYKADKALTKVLNKRVTELNEKIEKIEEEIKNQKKRNIAKNKELDDVKQCIVELYDNINSKIGKDDLKELYGFYLEHVNEIKFIRVKLGEVTEMQEKMRNDTPNFIKRLESLTHDISELQESDKKKVVGTRERQVDLSNYITEKKLKNILSPMTEELEKIMSETEYNSKNLSEIMDQINSFDKKSHVDHIEADLNEKINMMNNRYGKKFIEKIEFNKIIKNIDIQIKLLQGNILNTKKEEADNWLLAKQSIKCFNCATCEANIANSSPPNEYLPWNKYPQGEKQYRIGQGFSKLLKKLKGNIEDNNKIEKIDKNKILDSSIDNDRSNKFLVNSMNSINDFIKINYRMASKEEKGIAINLKKYKLPRVIESFRRKQKSVDMIPMTDDEKENEEAIIEKEIEVNSPKILKITKVKNDNEIFQNDSPLTNKNSRNKKGKNSGNKIDRIQSVPLY